MTGSLCVSKEPMHATYVTAIAGCLPPTSRGTVILALMDKATNRVTDKTADKVTGNRERHHRLASFQN